MKTVMDGIGEISLGLMLMLAAIGGAQRIVTHPITHSISYGDIILLMLIGYQIISDNAVTTMLGPKQLSTGKTLGGNILWIHKHLQQSSIECAMALENDIILRRKRRI